MSKRTKTTRAEELFGLLSEADGAWKEGQVLDFEKAFIRALILADHIACRRRGVPKECRP